MAQPDLGAVPRRRRGTTPTRRAKTPESPPL